MIIESFAKFNKFVIVKHYSDDGFTGSNFDRPAFEQLKQDIESRKIDCVIVKDLSRLGRELYLTGSYIEEYFLSKNVRFIAINDGYDSLVGDSMLGIRLSVNDMYLRDTSKKIRSSFDAKRKNGDYIGSYAKYGYQKDPNNPKRLIIDPNVAPIVKQIFEWAINGEGTSKIAGKLTDMQIPIPTIYKNDRRENTRSDLNNGNGIWRPQTVKSILEDKMYLGHMVQGRWKKLSYNSKKLVELPESEWFIVKNTHEAIIDQETFDRVQDLMDKNRMYAAKNFERYLLQGLLICKDCGHRLTITQKHKRKDVLVAQCSNYTKYGRHGICSSHYVRYDQLEDDILCFLQEVGELLLKNTDVDSILKQYQKMSSNDLSISESKVKQLQSEIQKCEALLERLYEDRLEDVITVDEYVKVSKKYKEKLESLNFKLKNTTIIDKEAEMEEHVLEYKRCKEMVERFMSFKEPTNALMKEIIDRIEIDKEKNVEVFFRADFGRFVHLEKKKGES